jgi:hypothetical protein
MYINLTGVDWLDLIPDSEKWGALMNGVLHFWVL